MGHRHAVVFRNLDGKSKRQTRHASVGDRGHKMRAGDRRHRPYHFPLRAVFAAASDAVSLHPAGWLMAGFVLALSVWGIAVWGACRVATQI